MGFPNIRAVASTARSAAIRTIGSSSQSSATASRRSRTTKCASVLPSTPSSFSVSKPDVRIKSACTWWRWDIRSSTIRSTGAPSRSSSFPDKRCTRGAWSSNTRARAQSFRSKPIRRPNTRTPKPCSQMFELKATAASARRATLHLAHGIVETPCFMPVGTAATVKGLTPQELREAHAQIVLANTYHLWLRPGLATIEAAGGLHRFMAWDGPILTDSGGFQVFSLESRRKLDDDGVTFRSHVDGSEHRFTPENVIAFQEAIGVDIAMVLDVCVKLPATRDQLEESVRLTTDWARRSAAARTRRETALFAIV